MILGHFFSKKGRKQKKDAMYSHRINILKKEANQIEYCILGQGDPLVLIMGYAGTMQGWDYRFLDYLAQSNQIILINNRNTGQSKNSKASFSMADLADDIETLRCQLKIATISLVGISMGGMIAQQYAWTYPRTIHKMILINTIPPGDILQRPHSSVEQRLRNFSEGKVKGLFKMPKLLFPSLWQVRLVYLYHFKANGGKNIVSVSTKLGQQAAIENWLEYKHPKQLLKKISAPTLILCGSADALIPPANSKIISQHLKKSILKEYKGGGHAMIYQYPKALADEIHFFMNRQSVC